MEVVAHFNFLIHDDLSAVQDLNSHIQINGGGSLIWSIPDLRQDAAFLNVNYSATDAAVVDVVLNDVDVIQVCLRFVGLFAVCSSCVH